MCNGTISIIFSLFDEILFVFAFASQECLQAFQYTVVAFIFRQFALLLPRLQLSDDFLMFVR